MSPIVYPQTDLKLEGTETEAGALNFAHTIGRFAFNSPTKDGNLTRTKGEESDAKPSLNGLYGQEPAKAKVEAELPFEILLSGTTGQNLQRSLSPLSHVSPPPSPPTTGRKRKQRTGDTSGNEYTPVKVSGSPRKKQLTTPTRKPSPKKARGFADPEVYAHLKPLADRLGTHLNGEHFRTLSEIAHLPNLSSDILRYQVSAQSPHMIYAFKDDVARSPGIESAIQGHHFAYKGNNFYKMIFFSGIATYTSKSRKYLTFFVKGLLTASFLPLRMRPCLSSSTSVWWGPYNLGRSDNNVLSDQLDRSPYRFREFLGLDSRDSYFTHCDF